MLHTVKATLAAGLLLVACGKSEKEPAPAVTPQPTPATPARPAPIDGGLQAHMKEHFESIRSVERAIVLGDMTLAKREAEALANHQSAQEIENYSEEIEGVRATATAIAKAETLAVMAASAATLATQCGSCHLITNSITSFEWTEAPVPNETGADRMQRHRWAMDRLWEGLVGPSQHSWRAGATVLQADPMPASMLSLHGMPEADAKAKLATLQSLATKAQSLESLDDRAKLYGELLTTCSGCHTKAIRAD